MYFARVLALTLATAWLAALIGCGDSPCTVSGTVTLDGASLPAGRISLRSAAQLSRSRPTSTAIEDGAFSFTRAHEVWPGPYVVAIEAWEPTGEELNVDEGEPLEEHRQFLPPKYNAKSELSVQVRGNTSGLQFKLESTPEPPPDEGSPDVESEVSSSPSSESDILE